MPIDFLLATAEAAAPLRMALDDPALVHGASAALQLPLAAKASGRTGDARWRSAAGATVAIHVFGTASDRDPDRVFGAPRASESPVATSLLHPREGRATLKYVVAGDIEASASADAGAPRARGDAAGTGRERVAAGLSASVDADARLGAYLHAATGTTLGSALATHAARMPWILDAASVAAMAPGEACFLVLGGRASAALEVDWADVFAGDLGALAGFADTPGLLAITLDASAGLAFRFSVEDAFRLVFVREANGVRAVVNRASDARFRLSADASIEIALADPEAARAVLAQVAARLLGPLTGPLRESTAALQQVIDGYDAALARIRAALGGAAATLEQWFDEHGLSRALQRLQALQSMVEEVGHVAPVLAQRLGLGLAQAEALLAELDAWPATLAQRAGDRVAQWLAPLDPEPILQRPREAAQALLARLEAIESTLVELAHARLSLAMSAEYERIDEDKTVLDVLLDTAHAEYGGRHADLLALRFDRVLVDALRQGAGVALRLFLHEHRLRRSFTLGLSLGDTLRQATTTGRSWLERRRMAAGADGAVRVRHSSILEGERRNEEMAFGSQARCRGELDARLHRDDEQPGRWRLELVLRFESRTPRAGRDWMHAAADYGAVFGIAGGDDAVALLLETLAGAEVERQPAGLSLALTVPAAAMATPALLDAWAQLDAGTAAAALAEALPVVGNVPARRDPAARRAAYGTALQVLLGDGGVDLQDARGIARHVGRHVGAGNSAATAALRRFELSPARPWLGTVAQLATHPSAGRVDGMVRGFRAAGASLAALPAKATGSARERTLVEEALQQLQRGWINRFTLRWQVAVLRMLAAQAALPASALRPRMALSVGVGAGAREQVIAPIG